MTFSVTRALIATTFITMTATASFAQGGAYYRGAPAEANDPSTINQRLTEKAQHEPGVTSELAPDAKQTATGGPVGGVPGFSGGK